VSDEFSCKPGSNCCALCSLSSCDCREYNILTALKASRAEVRRLLEREKAVVSKAEDAYTRLTRIGWDRTNAEAIEGAIEDLLAIRTMSLAALSALNPGEIKP
jgi:hypothetical protein